MPRQPHIEVDLRVGGLQPTGFDPFPADCGAESLFIGRTRLERRPDLGVLLRLDYEAHEAMALAEMRRLAVDAAARFECTAVRLVHAIGPVGVGQASVIVQVACGHRDAAFDACRHLIDALKARVPIWKREVWEGGATWSARTSAMVVESEPGPGLAETGR